MSKKYISRHKNETRLDHLLGLRKKEVAPWRIFKIMAEFVSGFEFLRRYKKAVTFFGSARARPKDAIYQDAERLAQRLAKNGFTVITGGGPGIMEAANRGAHEAGKISVGLHITDIAGFEKRNNYFEEGEAFKYFFTRKVMLAFASQVYIFFPGGFGTLDELFEMVTLVQTEKIPPIPVILVGKTYWTPLISWIEQTLLIKGRMIDKKDTKIYHLVNSGDEAFRLIRKFSTNRSPGKGTRGQAPAL